MKQISVYHDGAIHWQELDEMSLWVVRGDEELPDWGYKSRTASEKWNLFPCTPSVFRFAPKPERNIGDYRVDISPLNREIWRINDHNPRKIRYLYADNTALFNKTGYPRQQYLVMSGNILAGYARDGWLYFVTLTPQSDVSAITPESHPWFVHQFDLVCWNKIQKRTTHRQTTPQGIIRYFLTSREGWGCIPARFVRPKV
jgi:hypothetical protein